MYDTVEKKQKKTFGYRVTQKKVDVTRLNVIGENHVDRKEPEKAYLNDVYRNTKYGYWTETTFPFKTTDFNMEGDPQYLRFQFLVKGVMETMEEIWKEIDGNNKSNHLGKVRYLESVINIDVLRNQICGTEGSLARFIMYKKEESKDELESLICAAVEKIKSCLAKLEGVIANSVCLEKEKYKGNVKLVIDVILINCKNLVTKLGICYTKENYRRARSTAMDIAANEYFSQIGVWKIGESHRNDMNEFVNRRYNLIGMDEFNRLVNEGTYQQAQTGMKRFARLALKK